MGTKRRSAIFWLICLLLLTGCPSKPPQAPKQPAEQPLLQRISPAHLPDFQDDGSSDSLRSAIEKSLSWYTKNSPDKPVSLGNMNVPSQVFVESIRHFAALAVSGRITAEVLWKNFDIFRIVPPDNSGKMLVTGYYEPVVEGSLKPGDQFRWPIYPVPSDLLVVDLGRFDSNKFHGERLVGRVEGKYFVPYYSRSEIDGKKVLEKPAAQSAAPLAKPLAWLKDPVDCFFLHIQGSGVIRLSPDGLQVRVGYAGANGRPYYSIGKDLIEYTVDRSSFKQGRHLPGTHIPIYNPEHIRETKPDYVIILPWNLKDEIMQQLSYIREWGGRFVVPIPKVAVY